MSDTTRDHKSRLVVEFVSRCNGEYNGGNTQAEGNGRPLKAMPWGGRRRRRRRRRSRRRRRRRVRTFTCIEFLLCQLCASMPLFIYFLGTGRICNKRDVAGLILRTNLCICTYVIEKIDITKCYLSKFIYFINRI